MKKALWLPLAVVGAVLALAAGASILHTGKMILGYNAVYVGLAGLGVLTAGLLLRNE